MNVLYEENSVFKTGKILSKTEYSILIENEHGKKIKLKNNNCLLEYENPDPDKLISQANILADNIDIEFLWECSPEDIFYANNLAYDYFGHAPSPIEATAIMIKLHSSPIYFYKKGAGQYKTAQKENILLAIASIAKKKKQEEEKDNLINEMIRGRLPDIIKKNAINLVINPDKKDIAWKSLEEASKRLNQDPEELLLELGAWPNKIVLLKEKFLKSYFKNKIDCDDSTYLYVDDDLPISNAEIYSIDDASTTEIDDAISVTMSENFCKVGIHIAAPALAIKPGSVYDNIARSNSSTIYLPGEKITMLPRSIIDQFSLNSGKLVPSISLYIIFDTIDGSIVSSDTIIEKIKVKENLRIHEIENIFTESNLDNLNQPLLLSEWVRPLWKLTQILSLKREERRGYPENISRPEFTFKIDGDVNDPKSKVSVEKRSRNHPISRIIAEFMIITNSLWAAMLKNYGVAGVYRSQQSYGRVKMSTHPLPHEYIGVDQYMWSTSPLRRYIDLVNQWQIISAIKYNISAPLIATFKSKDHNLFDIIQEFEVNYNMISSFQNEIENFWSIKWLQQEKIEVISANVLKENLVRINDVPLIVQVENLPKIEKGTSIKIKILSINEKNQIRAQYIENIE